ncbi:RNA polymerase sigma-70 domain protein [Candidatus Thiomargarita nelsonii]|uniref:RNA polymerase sigma-70 domain protein n=1 Tax=Candidatus Thiomargarita nelsonii TaxID=1003181 RepID=A0A176RUA4_9GAMM|nr:RNA polymerase sigma-70 domain protein [Candidatus Thiomargarita nelsonii]
MDEKAALKDIRNGGKKGCTVLYKQYVNSLRYFLISKHHIPENDVDDVLQETFFKFVKSIHRFKENCKVSTWLYIIAKNVANDYWRKQHDHSLVSLDEDEWENHLLDEISEEQSKKEQNDLELMMCLERVLALLERDGSKTSHLKCLKALTLRAQGSSVKDVANQIGRTNDATRKYLEGCRKTLRQYQPLQNCWKQLSD